MTGATGRLPRLLALVPYLLRHPGAPVEEVARRFGIGEKQLVRDLELVWMCGLPGHTPADLIDVSIDGGRITVTNAETIARPLRLTTDEALALLVALRALADLPGLTDRDAVDRALAKLERAAGDAAAVSARVAVAVEGDAPAAPLVADALARGRRLHLRYYVPGRDELTERDVDPMRLLVVDGRTYLEAWCRRVEAVRLFRLDRIVGIEVLAAAAEPPPDAPHRDLATGLYTPDADAIVVTLALGPAARWVADYYPCESVEEAGDGQLRVVLRASDPRWLRRLVLGLGGSARVLAPPELVADVARAAGTALARYAERPEEGKPAEEG